MNFEERYSVWAQKELKHIDFEIAIKIFEFMESLKENPFPSKAKRCKNPEYNENVFEVNIENYRILYEILFKEKIILIHKIEKLFFRESL